MSDKGPKPYAEFFFGRGHLHLLMFCQIRDLNLMERAKVAKEAHPLKKGQEKNWKMYSRKNRDMNLPSPPLYRVERMTRHLWPSGRILFVNVIVVKPSLWLLFQCSNTFSVPLQDKTMVQCFRQTAPLWESRVAFRGGPQKNGLALYFYKAACRLNPGLVF